MADREETKEIEYIKAKYLTTKNAWFNTGILDFNVGYKTIHLYPDGRLFVGKGTPWDGPSGPAVDTPSFMRPSLAHDMACLLIALGLIPPECQIHGHKLMKRLFKEDHKVIASRKKTFVGRKLYSTGAFFRRGWTYAAVKWFGNTSENPFEKPETLTAP